jgi:hypothetical protein
MTLIKQGAIPLSLILFILFGAALSSHGQSDAQSSAHDILTPVQPGNIPKTGTFFLLSGYLSNGGSLSAPYPFNPATNAEVFSLNGGRFIVDDTAMTNDSDALNALALLLQPSDAFSATLLNGMAADSIDINPGDSGDYTNSSGGYFPQFTGYTFDTNLLWLEITNVLDGSAYLNLHNATDQVYAIWGTSNLPGPWNVECELWPTNSAVMPFAIPTLDQQDLFLLAEDWTGVTENGNTTPDWWFWKYFGTTSLFDTNLDSQSNTLIFDYLHGVDPNPIAFSVFVTNNYVNATSVPVNVLITGGTPSYYSVVDSNNSTPSATAWLPFTSSNLTASLNSNEGKHTIWIGMRGLPSDAWQSWRGVSVTLDTTPPVILITNAPPAEVSQPFIQVQGLVDEDLRSLTFDVSNAAGTISNQTGYLTGQYYDTNLATFTTNSFQCYDVALTNGINSLTIRATDLAGNSSTTNLGVTLDYSSDTNPPVIQYVWPHNGTQIAGDSFTMQALVDDPTATVTVSVADSSNNTNVFQPKVNRSGSVYVQDVPLAAGTNTVAVTATDPAGNTSTATMNVIRNILASVNMGGISAGQLNQSLVSLSGTVNNASFHVIANGVAAVVDSSGNWTATNVPVNPAGTANVTVDVYDSGDNLVASQIFTQQQPPLIQVMSYESAGADYWSCGANGEAKYWTRGVGGVDDSWYTGTPNITGPTGTQIITQLGQDYDGSSGLLSGDWSATYSGDDVCDGNATDLGTFHGLTTTAINPGDGPVGGTRVYLVRVAAEEYLWPGGPNDWTTFNPVPPESIQINGVTLVGTGQMADLDTNTEWGETLVEAPAGVQPRVTPAFNAPLQYNEYLFTEVASNALKIIDLNSGLDVSAPGQTNTVVVGQQINLAFQLITTNFSVQSYQWTVPGYAISNYVVAPDISSATVVTNFPLNNSNVVFYWVDGATNRVVKCSATVNGKTLTAQAAFNVLRPTADWTAQADAVVSVDSNYTFRALHFGFELAATNRGMLFNFSNPDPRGYTGITVYRWGQLANLYIRGNFVTNNVGFIRTGNGVDTIFPVSGFLPTWAPTNSVDSPGKSTDILGKLILQEYFTNYLFFQSAASNSILVPIKMLQWSWGGLASNDFVTGWTLLSSPTNYQIPVNNQDTMQYPTWSNNATNYTQTLTNWF